MNNGPGALNRIYRLVWNEEQGAFVAVAEHARGRGKRSARVGAALVLGVAAFGAAWAGGPSPGALPTGGTVVAGQANIAQQGSQMTVQQGSSRAAIDWTSFNIGTQAQVRFAQPDAASVALNRVTGADVSSIQGQLSANGQVILVNPNGVVFGAGSRVDVGGLVASSLDLSAADFMAGRLQFKRGTATGSVVNQGQLNAASGGYVALLAPEVRNEGVISAQLGTVALAAGDAVTLDVSGSQLLGIKVDPATLDALVENRQAIVAEGGRVLLSAGAANRLLEQAVAGQGGATAMVAGQDGSVRLVSAGGTVQAGAGRIEVQGGMVDLSGQLQASGAQAGRIDVAGDYVAQSGTLAANASAGQGGHITVQGDSVVQTAYARVQADGVSGGAVRLEGGHTVYSSASVSAQGAQGTGGDIAMTAQSVQLRAAQVDASGATGGGRVRIGGGFQGAAPDLANAQTVGVNGTTVLRADARAQGDGGEVVVWSDGKTTYAGQLSARGGAAGGHGGQAEVSGKGDLVFAGGADLRAPQGAAGRLLLDPRNIIIDDAGTSVAALQMDDPTPDATSGFGTASQVLGNGNVIITAPTADTGGTADTGAAYLFDSKTGALLTNLRGSHAGDKIGSAGVQVLDNGHYLVFSPEYGTVTGVNTFDPSANTDPGTYQLKTSQSAAAGAITWQNGAGQAGASSLVSSTNSLVGSTSNTDSVTRYTYTGSTVTTNGTATVTANDRLGDVTTYDLWGGVDHAGTTTVYTLSDGNLAIANARWYNGRGAVTWMNAATGALVGGGAGAEVSSSVALVGSTGIRSEALVATDAQGDKVYVTGMNSSLPYLRFTNTGANARTTPPGGAGDAVGGSLTLLPGGGYVVSSPTWSNGGTAYAGAVTWSGAGGVTGAVSDGNSVVGTHAFDFVGSGGITTVGSNGANYVIASPYWSADNNAAAGKFVDNAPNGAVTWVDGSTGHAYGESATGAAVSSSNSLIGNAGDALGAYSNSNSTLTARDNFTTNPCCTNNTTYATRVAAGASGLISLANGNYLVVDTSWNAGAGSVSFLTGALGGAGVVSSSNSLVGGTANDHVGSAVVQLSGSHYAVVSPDWDNTGAVDAGAVTRGSGTTGVTGTVSASNSLVGTDGYERVGSGGVLTVGSTGADGLRNDYLVLSPHWGNRSNSATSTVAYGAVTWVSGATGQAFGEAGTGAAVSSANSLVGSHAGDYVGSYHYADTRSLGGWDGIGAYQLSGAWTAALTNGVEVMANGDYIVRSASWDAGKGAVTWGSGGSGVAGAVSSANSLVGSTADVYSTVVTSGISRNGYNVTDTQILLTTTGDHVGLVGEALANGNYVAISPFWNNGAGAITWVGAGQRTGVVGAANSVVGSTSDVFTDAQHTTLVSTGDRLGSMATTTWTSVVISEGTRNSNTYSNASVRPLGPRSFATAYTPGGGVGTSPGALTPVNAAIVEEWGYVSTGFVYNGYPIVKELSNGNLLVASPSWHNGAAAEAGAVTWINGTTGQLANGQAGGALDATNSLVGSHAGDLIGYRLPLEGAVELNNGNFLLVNPQWYDERGAVTWGSGTAGLVGTISDGNSLVGERASGSISLLAPNVGITYIAGRGFTSDMALRTSDHLGDQVGSSGITVLSDGNAVIASALWNQDPQQAWDHASTPSSYGAATWINGSTGHLIDGSSGGALSAANSLVGSQHGDAVAYNPLVDNWNNSIHYESTGVTALAGGRYAVASPWWSNGGTAGVGAVTFGAAGGIAGAVSSGNSLTGGTAGDHVGLSQSFYDPYTWYPMHDAGVQVVSDGVHTNYYVRSYQWTNVNDTANGGAGAGAVTWVDGSNGQAYGESSTGAVVSARNSIVGNVAGDGVGSHFMALTRDVNGTAVATGDVLLFSNISYCGTPDVGAVTLLSGLRGTSGPISWRNSVIGFASGANGQRTTALDDYGHLSDIHVALLPTAVSSAEAVAWRPFLWTTPNPDSGQNGTSAMAITLLHDDATQPHAVDDVNAMNGHANWSGSYYVNDNAAYTTVGGDTATGLLGFSALTGGDVVITPNVITGLLNNGTDVALQASNDITVLRDITTSANGQGGDLTLEAGRSVHLNANITTDNGSFSVYANQRASAGVVDADCGTCTAEITQQAGTQVNAGTGSVNFTLFNGDDKTYHDAGDIRLASIDAASIAIRNQGVDASGNGRGIRFQAGATLGGSGTEEIVLQAHGDIGHGGGVGLQGDTHFQGGTGSRLVIASSVESEAAEFGFNSGTGLTLSMTGGEMIDIITRSSGFDTMQFGRDDQAGLTSVGNIDLNQVAAQADLRLQAGSGGMHVLDSVQYDEAGHRLTLAVRDGEMRFDSNSGLTGLSGVVELLTEGAGSTVVQDADAWLSASQLLLTGDGAVDLHAGNNTIGTLAGTIGQAEVTAAHGHLTVGAIADVNGLTTQTGQLLRTTDTGGDVVLDQAVQNTSGDLTVVAARHFVNNVGTQGLDPGSGRYLVYSTNPTDTIEGVTGYSKHYNQAYTGSTPAYATSGNWFLYSIAPTLTASVGSGSTITYGQSGAAPGVSVTGFIDGDTEASATTGSLDTSFSSYTASGAGFIPVGTYTVSLNGQGTFANSLGYQMVVNTGSSSLTVQAKQINVSGLTADSKVYDGTTATTVSGTASLQAGGATTSDGLAMNGDSISLSGTATGAFADRHVGTAKSVTLSGLTLSGADAGNYVISTSSVTADITAKTLDVSGLTAASSKVYDGNTSAVVSGTGSFATQTAGQGTTQDGKAYTVDTVSLTGTATGTYNNANVASANSVAFGGLTLTGTDAGNYVLSLGSQAATITAKALDVGGLTAAGKVYDASTAATLSGTAALTGGGSTSSDGHYVTGDTVSLSGTASGTFSDANAGTGKTVTVAGLTLAGTSAGNYTLNALTLQADIDKRTVDVTAANQSKTYGDTDPALTYSVGGLGLVGNDTAATVFSGALTTATGSAATAGTHAITQGTLAVADGNYQLGQLTNGTLTVAKAALTVTADDKSKTYGDTDPTLTYAVNTSQLKYSDTASVVSGVSLSTVTGAQAAAGTHAITGSGGVADNYDVTVQSGTLTVAKAALTVTADDKSKTYGDTDPTLTYAVNTSQLKYSDTASVVSGVSLSTATGAQATAGTHSITGSSGVADNYDVTVQNGTLTVAKAALTVTADDKSKTYGDADPTLTYAVNTSQLKYSDTASVVSGVSLSTATGAQATAGTHSITGSGGVADNYDVTVQSGTLTVAKAALTVTADDKSKTYGDTDPTLTYAVNTSQLKYSDTASVVSGVSLSTVTGAQATAGSHAITGTAGLADNYDVTVQSGTLTVAKAALTVTADDKSKTYGDTDPALTYAVNTAQLKYSDTASVVSGVSLSTTTGAQATAGTHAITGSGGVADNYDVTVQSGTLTVAKAALTVTADDKSKTYGDTDPTLTYAVNTSQLKYSDTASVVSGVSLSTVTGAQAAAGTHAITGSGGVADNYDVTVQNGTLTVAKAALTVTADDKSKTYGDTDPTLTYAVNTSQLKYSDTASAVSGVSLSTATGAQATAGTHSITGSGGVADNYDVTVQNGTLTVAKAALTVTADDKSKTYGDADPTLTYAVNTSQLKYSDTASVVSGVSLSTATGAQATAGTHSITGSGGVADNYDVTVQSGTLTVAKAALTVTADDKSKTYGDTDPTLTYAVNTSQLKYSDTASVVSGVSLSTTTGAQATAGTHSITGSGGVADNYDVTVQSGTLTVAKAALTVTADDKSKTYGDTDPTLTYAVNTSQLKYSDTASVVSGVSLSTVTGAQATAGSHAITGTAGLADNYDVTVQSGTLTVAKAALTVTADDKSKTYGDTDPALTYAVNTAQLKYSDTASVVSGVSLSTTTGAQATAGTHAITGSGGVADNYDVTVQNGTLTVAKAALTVTADDKSKTYGDTDPTLTYAVNTSQLKYSDTASVVSGVSLSTVTGAQAAAGSHAISATGGVADNYDVTVQNGTLTVAKAALTVTADDKSKTYGDTDPTLTYAVNTAQLKYSDTAGVVSGVSLSTTTGAQATAGTHVITGTAGLADNYDVTVQSGTLTVAKAALTVTADDKSKTYGDTDPTLTYAVNTSQLKYSDTASAVSGVSLSTATGAQATAGTHAITGSGGVADNYDVTVQGSTLTVAKAALTVTADDKSKTYGDTDPTLTYAVNTSQLKYSDTGSVVSGVSLSTATGAQATAGTHSITGSGGVADNYDVTVQSGTLTVAKAALTVTADDKSKTYGDTDPTLTYAVNTSQLKYSDTASVVSGVSLSTVTGAQATAGTHSITGSGGVADNYDVTVQSGTLTVAKAALTVTADDKSKTYGDTDPTLTYAVNTSQLKYSDTASVVSSVSLSTATGAQATAGTHAITGSGGVADNYDVTVQSGTLTVAKAALTVTADDKSKTYGDTDPTLTYAVNPSQLKYSDTASVVSGVGLSTVTGAQATAGSHAITATGGVADNYDVTVQGGTLTVAKAALTVTADDKSKTYGDADPTLTYAVNTSQLKYSDTASVVSGVSLSTATGAQATAGSHAITGTAGVADNYNVTVQSGTLTVARAALTVTADDKSKTYGDTDPALTYAVNTSQLKYSDTANVVSGVALSTATGAQATAGTHAITGTGGLADNYDVTVHGGTLTVAKAALTVTAEDQRKTYGDTDPALTYAVDSSQLKYSDTASVVSGVSLSTAIGAQATAGTHTIVAIGGVADNYDVTVHDGLLTVDKARLDVAANHQSKTAGETDPSLTWRVADPSQLKYGDTASVVQGLVLSAPTGAGVPPGDYVIHASGGVADNYELARTDGVLTVKPSPSIKAENLVVQVGDVTRTAVSGTGTGNGTGVGGSALGAPVQGPAGNSGIGAPGSLVVVGGGLGGGNTGGLGAGGQGTGAGGGLGGGTGSGGLGGGNGAAGPQGGGQMSGQAGATGAQGPGSGGGVVAGGGASAGNARLIALQPSSEVRTVTGQPISVPVGSVFDRSPDVEVQFSATLADGSPLPAWLSIDPANGTLSGTPPQGTPASLQVLVRARSETGLEARTQVNLAVQ